MNSEEKILKIKEKINETLKINDYIFRNREDFIESRTDWNRLAEIVEEFYWLLRTINEDILK